MSARAAPDGAVRIIHGDETLGLRQEVLRPGQPREACRLPQDEAEHSFHLGAFDAHDALVAVASFSPEPPPAILAELGLLAAAVDGQASWRLRGMATAPEARGLGHGRALLRVGLDALTERGAWLLWCNARLGAVGFYERLGLRRAGETFDIAGIGEHVVMWQQLRRR